MGDEISDLPTGTWLPDVTSGGSVTVSGGNTVVRLNNGGYIEEGDYRYTCQSAGGCEISNRAVVSGSIVQTSTAAMGADTQPSFAGTNEPGDQTYTVGTAIEALTLPTASGGDGTLTYSLTSSVPGLSFDAATRQLTGTPTTAGSYIMTYSVADEDGDTATLSFTITVNSDSSGTATGGDCYVSLLVRIGESCTYPGTMDAFSVNAQGRGQFLSFLAGIRIRIDNATINGRVYDLLASHQGDGVWRIDRVAGSTEAPATPPTTGGGEMGPEDTSPSFAANAGPGNQTYTVGTAIATLTLPAASGGDGTLSYSLAPSVAGLTFSASTRRLTGTPSTAGAYAMTYSVTDDDGDADSLTFTITVEASDDGGDGGRTGDDISITNTRCNGRRVFAGSPIIDVTMGGTLTANVSVLSVDVTGFANNRRVGSDFVGSISAGESEDFSISGTVIITNATPLDCRVEINYRHRSGVDGSTDAVGISLGGQILN